MKSSKVRAGVCLVAWLIARTELHSESSPEWELVAAGVWKASLGKTEALDLLGSAGAKPRSDRLSLLPKAAFPFSKDDAAFTSNGGGVGLPYVIYNDHYSHRDHFLSHGDSFPSSTPHSLRSGDRVGFQPPLAGIDTSAGCHFLLRYGLPVSHSSGTRTKRTDSYGDFSPAS